MLAPTQKSTCRQIPLDNFLGKFHVRDYHTLSVNSTEMAFAPLVEQIVAS